MFRGVFVFGFRTDAKTGTFAEADGPFDGSLLKWLFAHFLARHLHDGLLLSVVVLKRMPAVLLGIGKADDLVRGGCLDGVGWKKNGRADAEAALRELGAAAREDALSVGQDAEDAEVLLAVGLKILSAGGAAGKSRGECGGCQNKFQNSLSQRWSRAIS